MVRSYEELNKLERTGLMELLRKDGWRNCVLGDNPAMTKTMEGKDISVEINNFNADED